MASAILASLRRRRASPMLVASKAATSSEEAELGAGFGLLGAGAHKRRRQSAPLEPALPPPPCEALTATPAFDADVEADDEVWADAWDGGNWGLENQPPNVQPAAVDSQELFEEFNCTPPSGAGLAAADPLPAFLRVLGGGGAAAGALAMLERLDFHCVGAGEYACLEASVAGMLVLCRRAKLGPTEMSDAMLLTLMWLQVSTSSQYYAPLGWWVNTFCCWCPPEEREALRADLPRLQLQVLQRCGWRVLLRSTEEVHGALRALRANPAFEPCIHALLRAAHGWTSCARSPEATPQLHHQAFTPPSDCSEQTAGPARRHGGARTVLHLR